jgi:hypothetical protein
VHSSNERIKTEAREPETLGPSRQFRREERRSEMEVTKNPPCEHLPDRLTSGLGENPQALEFVGEGSYCLGSFVYRCAEHGRTREYTSWIGEGAEHYRAVDGSTSCPVPHKIAYPSRHDATAGGEERHFDRRDGTPKPIDVYGCPCGAWHVRSRAVRRGNA